MKDYLSELVSRIDGRYSIESQNMSMGDWLCENTSLHGRPFSFDRYPFQKAIADDMHPNMDVIKPSQVGLSEVQIRKSLAFISRHRHTNLIFTLPNDDMYDRMSAARILPMAKTEKAFNLSDDKPIRSKGLIQVGSSFMYVTGAKEGDATSISADVVMNDEVDLTNQQMLSLFNSRLQNSDFKINQRFSTPTFTGYGVDAGYAVSDQREYMIKCDACSHWNTPIFTKDFVEIPGLPESTALSEIDEQLIDRGQIFLGEAHVCCEKCRAPLDLSRHEAREWVAKYPSRTHHRGYRVSPFSTDRLSVEYIITQMFRYRQRDYMRGWHNTVLGMAHTDGNARLSDAEIMRCFTSEHTIQEPSGKAVWLGVDIGQTCHLVLSEGDTMDSQQTLMFKTLPVEDLLDEVKFINENYNLVGGAVDRFPYTPTADAIRDLTGGKVLPVEYRGEKPLNLVKDQLTEEVTHGQVNRTSVIDATVGIIRKARIRFRGYTNQRTIISDHLKDMVRDEQPEKPAKWIKLTGQDHYFHALIFLTAGMKLKELENGLISDNRSTVAVFGANLHGGDLSPYGIEARRTLDLGLKHGL